MEYRDNRYFTNDFSYERYLLTTEEIMGCIDDAVRDGKPYSLSRFGHAEIAELRIFPDFYNGMTYYRRYNGLAGQNIRAELIKAFTSATTAGILSTWENASGAEYSKKAFLDLSLGFYTICSAWVTHHMTRLPNFWQWMQQYRVILAGRRAAEAAPVFQRNGVTVVDTVNLEGYEQLETAYEQLRGNKEWQVSLIAAGIPATLLAPRLANDTGRVALDFGHALDLLIDGQDGFDFEALVRNLR
ncbi:GT-D fold domain-containing glycosyltransferase [Paenibacillus sp. D51F]